MSERKRLVKTKEAPSSLIWPKGPWSWTAPRNASTFPTTKSRSVRYDLNELEDFLESRKVELSRRGKAHMATSTSGASGVSYFRRPQLLREGIGKLSRPSRGWSKANCPFHSSKSKTSFSVNLEAAASTASAVMLLAATLFPLSCSVTM